jgi:Polyketide cyclase / dehydrase and lipid transport
VTYRLHYHYDRPHRVWWEFIEGEGIEHVEGEYLLEPSDGGTRATYKLGIDPGVPIPGIIAGRLHKGVMRRSVQDLKRRVEG